AFSPDGTVLVTAGHFHRLFVWDTATARALGAPLRQGAPALDLAFSPDGRTLAAGTEGREVHLWDVTPWQPRRPPLRHDGPVRRGGSPPAGGRVPAACRSAAHLWDVAGGQKVGVLAYPPAAEPDGDRHLHVRFSPDGAVILTSPGHGSFRLWDAATARPLG